MFNEIIVPVDGSGFGELALPRALGIACKSGGEVRVVTVVTPLPSLHPEEEEGNVLEVERLDLAQEHALRYMRDLQKRVILAGCDVPISCHVEVGPVVERLFEHVRGVGGDLLVMTTHGRGPLRRAWLGSVADGLLRRTPCPILVIRPGEGEKLDLAQAGFHHLLVTLDGSPESREVLPFASTIASLFGSRLTLLRVIPPHFLLGSTYIPHPTREVQGLEAEQEAAREYLDAEAQALRERGLAVEVETVAGAHPVEGILQFVAGSDVDLVAMATHGRGGVARLILGSVADKVIRGGSVPVLLHRAL